MEARAREKLLKLNAITGDAISAMHSSLSTAPEADKPTETPDGLRTELMRHQKTGLTWLLWREKQSPPGGILADDMGLGKTLLMLSLIVEMRAAARAATGQEEDRVADRIRRRILCDNYKLVKSNATLVIAPASLIYQWEREVKDRVRPGTLRVLVFHGPKQQRSISAFELASYDIVITTYNLVSSELSDKRSLVDLRGGAGSGGGFSPARADPDEINSPFAKKTKKGEAKIQTTKRFLPSESDSVLTQILWERVILDEAHQIKNRRSLISRGCCRIPAVYRWCLTGTPIHNELWDLFSLIRFLRITPFSEEPVWKDFIMNVSKNSAKRLNTLVKGVLLRRTKAQLDSVTRKPLVELPSRRVELVSLELKELEAKCYGIMFEASKQKVKALLQTADQWGSSARAGGAGSSKRTKEVAVRNPFIYGGQFVRDGDRFQAMSCILALLLRLRQACVHMALTRNAIDMSAFKDEHGIGEGDEEMNELDKTLAQLSLNESSIGRGEEKENVEAIFDASHRSTKISALLEHLQNIVGTGDKCVVVSQWTSVLDMVEQHLKRARVHYTAITGSVQSKDRQERVDSFNRRGGGAQVLLLSLTAGGVGLNLVGGNHLFMVDPHWNPAIEAQACDRIYRMGQLKDVVIHKLICQKTIEQRVLQLQEKKLLLANQVLQGATAHELSKLTVANLQYLFELEK